MRLSIRSLFDHSLFALLIVSIGFGFLKQVKKTDLFPENAVSTDREAGVGIELLRNELLARRPLRELKQCHFSYLSDRQTVPGERPAKQYYYDAQYAFAPLSLFYQEPSADFYVLDFISSEALQRALSQKSLIVLSKQGDCILATKETGRVN